MKKGKIAAATGTASAGEKITASMVEEAMSAAVVAAMKKGITDSDEILKMKQEARRKVMAG